MANRTPATYPSDGTVERRCSGCLKLQPITEFSVRSPGSRRQSGQVSARCKECERSRRRALAKRPENLERSLRNTVKWQRANPEAYRRMTGARDATKRLIVYGQVRPRPEACERCHQHRPRIQIHHLDYACPELIEWLCPVCHRVADRERRQREEIGAG